MKPTFSLLTLPLCLALLLPLGCITTPKGEPKKATDTATTKKAPDADKATADAKKAAADAKKAADKKAAEAKKMADAKAKKAADAKEAAEAKKAADAKQAAEAKKKADAAKKKAAEAKKAAAAKKAADAKKMTDDEKKAAAAKEKAAEQLAAAKKKAAKDGWSYDGITGPAMWGKLKPEWALAATGKAQSPIDIKGATAGSLPELKVNYVATKVHLVNNGHTVKVNVDEGSSITLGGTTYALKQFHFHGPSEHTIDGASYPLEMHMVHKSADGQLAVVGLLFYEGRENPFLANFWDVIPLRKGKLDPEITVHPLEVLPGSLSYYGYDGSLTTPPCTEGVKWLVLKDAVYVSKEQIKEFKRAFKNNARPVQPLNGRKIGMK